jgi:hypothetical protein
MEWAPSCHCFQARDSCFGSELLHVCHEQPTQRTDLNALPYLATLLRVGHRGQGYEDTRPHWGVQHHDMVFISYVYIAHQDPLVTNSSWIRRSVLGVALWQWPVIRSRGFIRGSMRSSKSFAQGRNSRKRLRHLQSSMPTSRPCTRRQRRSVGADRRASFDKCARTESPNLGCGIVQPRVSHPMRAASNQIP